MTTPTIERSAAETGAGAHSSTDVRGAARAVAPLAGYSVAATFGGLGCAWYSAVAGLHLGQGHGADWIALVGLGLSGAFCLIATCALALAIRDVGAAR